jgi:hypothetical protein
VFVGVAADGDDAVEVEAGEVGDGFGGVAGDIDAGFGHDADGGRIEAVFFNPGRAGFDAAGVERAGEAFGHLAAATVAGAEEEDA